MILNRSFLVIYKFKFQVIAIGKLNCAAGAFGL